MPKKFTAVITREDKWYIAHCIELGVVSQGRTIEEAQKNLKEAVELYLESFGGEDLPESEGEILIYPFEIAMNA
jgi:predicted RNase H-like HicB family nuclease